MTLVQTPLFPTVLTPCLRCSLFFTSEVSAANNLFEGGGMKMPFPHQDLGSLPN